MAEIQSVLAANVRKYRKAANLSQDQLAEIAGLHRTYIGGIEQKRVNVSLKNIGKIAVALGVDPALLFLSRDSFSSGSSKMNETAKHRESLSGASTPSLQSPTETNDATTQTSNFALVSWKNDELILRPIEVSYEDLTIQVLCYLVEKGYDGNDLASQYAKTHSEVVSFLESSAPVQQQDK